MDAGSFIAGMIWGAVALLVVEVVVFWIVGAWKQLTQRLKKLEDAAEEGRDEA